MVLLALLAAAGFGIKLWRHPTELGQYGDDYGFRTTTAPNRALWVSVSRPALHGDLIRIHIDSVTPDVTRDGGAAISAWICNNDGGVNVHGRTHLAFGSALGADVQKYCRVLVPAEAADLVISPNHHQQILLRLEGTPPVSRRSPKSMSTTRRDGRPALSA